MEELIARNEPMANHLKHLGKMDPNLYIYNSHLENGNEKKAAEFLDYREKWEKARVEPSIISPHPLHVSFAFQNSCNLKCPHCYRQYNDTESTRGALKLEEIYNLIDQCKEAGVPSIQLGAGIETFLYPKISEVIQYISDKNFQDFWIGTNGIHLEQDKADLLLETNVTRLEISIDAFTPETYAKVRGGDYYKLMKNIFYFLEQRNKKKKKLPLLRVSFVKYNLSEHEADDFVKFWRNYATEVDIQPLINVKNVNTLPFTDIEPEEISCRYPTNMLWIDWNGDYRPCCTDFSKYVTIGNFKDMSVQEAWHAEYINSLRAQMRGEEKMCRACVTCHKSFNSDEIFEPLTAK